MAIITVTTTADSGAGSLRAAITAANDGDVIQFDATVFPSGTTTAILLASSIGINKAVTINAGAAETPQRVALDAQGAGRCLYLQSDASVGVIGVIFRNASQAGNGGAIYCGSTYPCEFTDCVFDSSTGNTGGGLSTTVAAELLFARCAFTNNTASGNGGALYASSSASLTIAFCEFAGNTSSAGVERRGVYLAGTSAVTIYKSTLDALFVYTTAAASITAGIVTVAELTLQNNVVVSITDGAALTVTTTATIGSATLSSDGRGYLATAAGIDTSAATLNNVVACTYGAGLTSFTINDAGAIWTADDLTTTVLLETRDNGGDWDTLAQAAGGSYVATFGVGTVARAFDGARFWVAEISAYWQVASFVVANNGGGGAGDSAACWVVENKTITPNIGGV